jgi:histidinol-phosphate/aromatic aminotransferase/cobyric acid decarboxylase-like protein
VATGVLGRSQRHILPENAESRGAVFAAFRGCSEDSGTQRDRRERLALSERGIKVHAQAGITVWIPVPDEAHVVQALLQRGWAVSPGAPYRLQSERAVRVTISALQEDEADDLASAIANSLRPSLRTRTP